MSSHAMTYSQSTLAAPKPSKWIGKTRVAKSSLRCPRPNHSAEPSSLAAKGIIEDFSALYDTYRRRVLSQCYAMLRNHTEAEDAAQEVFLRVHLKAHTFRGESSFATWLHRLTTNCVLMEIRKKRRRGLES